MEKDLSMEDTWLLSMCRQKQAHSLTLSSRLFAGMEKIRPKEADIRQIPKALLRAFVSCCLAETGDIQSSLEAHRVKE